MRALGVVLLLAAVAAAGGIRAQARGPAQLYVTLGGSDAHPCTKNAPCKTFQRAYDVAHSRATVYVGKGTYPRQELAAASSAHARVTFAPAPRAIVLVKQMEVRAAHVEFQNMTIADVDVPRDAFDVTFRNVKNHGFFVQGATNVSFIGGEISCGVCAYHSHIDDGGPPDYPPTRNLLFDGVYFHDWQAATPDQHTECLQILSGDGITIRNSVFRNCATANNGRGATANLHISFFGNGPVTHNILIENNFFYPSGNPYTIQSDDFAHLVFRNNSISGPVIVFGGFGDGTPVQFIGNVMRYSSCKSQPSASGPVAPLAFKYNVQQGGTCGPTDVNAPLGFVDPARNLHLRAGAAAINHGDPASYPARDIDGNRRPRGPRPDAGADELR